MDYNTTFEPLKLFVFNYKKDFVLSRMIHDLQNIKSLSVRYDYLKSAWEFIRSIKPNEPNDLMFSSVLELDYNKERNESSKAYYEIKVWIDEEFKKVELEVKKEEKKEVQKKEKAKKKQIMDTPTTFEIKEEYTHLLKSVWMLMKDHKSNMIENETEFDDFKKVFLKVEENDIANPIHWRGCKSTLLRLFDDLMNEKILLYISLGKQTSSKYTNPLDICFVKDKKCNKFLKWKSSYAHLNGFIGRKTKNQETIDKVIRLFKADTKIEIE